MKAKSLSSPLFHSVSSTIVLVFLAVVVAVVAVVVVVVVVVVAAAASHLDNFELIVRKNNDLV